MLETLPSAPLVCLIIFSMAMTCCAISPGVRFLSKPACPLAQKEQAYAQPTCVETQTVFRSFAGIKTVSMKRPSANLVRSLTVPSVDFWRSAF